MRHPLHFPGQHCLDVGCALHVLSHGDCIQRLQQCGRGKLAQFRLFVRHGSDQKNSPSPHGPGQNPRKRPGGEALVLPWAGRKTFRRLSAPRSRQSGLGAPNVTRSIWSCRASGGYSPHWKLHHQKSKRRCQSDIAAVVINCFLSFHPQSWQQPLRIMLST